MDSKISIIIPIFNAEEHLSKCISSVISQTYSNLEIILINDGSTDGSLAICKAFADKDKRIKVISKKMREYPRQEIQDWMLLQENMLVL